MSFIPVPTDNLTGAEQSIEWEHSRIHDGKGFTNSNRFTLNNNVTAYHIFRNPIGNYPHIRTLLVTATGAPIEISIHEAPTVTGVGTLTTSANNNRNSANSPALQLYQGSTVSAEGTFLAFDMLTGSKTSGGMGSENAQREWNVAPGTDMLLKVVNVGAGNVVYGLKVFWYES